MPSACALAPTTALVLQPRLNTKSWMLVVSVMFFLRHDADPQILDVVVRSSDEQLSNYQLLCELLNFEPNPLVWLTQVLGNDSDSI